MSAACPVTGYSRKFRLSDFAGLTVSSNLCVAVPDGATELERLRDRNQGIAPPSNADLIAIIRAKDDLICQLKTAALETDRLRDRVEQLEQLVGVDRSLTSRLRTAFGLEPRVAQVMGTFLDPGFPPPEARHAVLNAARRAPRQPQAWCEMPRPTLGARRGR